MAARKIGSWTIQSQLGEGGQAHIFKVVHDDGRIGALKRLKNVTRLERFKDEIFAVGDSSNQCRPEILDHDLEAPKPYFVMEYFPNGCLREEIIRGWSPVRKVEFFLGLLFRLSWAHAQGAVHRDLKPANILLDNELTPRIADWGLVHLGDVADRRTQLAEAVGSFKYMAPEMENGRVESVGPCADIYSLGKIAYWLFSSGKIYNRERHRHDEYDLSKVHEGEHWCHYLNDFIDKATYEDPAKRIQTVTELVAAFRETQSSIESGARYLSTSVDQVCVFCRKGRYAVKINSKDSLSRSIDSERIETLGYKHYPGTSWLILVCEECGNMQAFRRDYAASDKWNKS